MKQELSLARGLEAAFLAVKRAVTEDQVLDPPVRGPCRRSVHQEAHCPPPGRRLSGGLAWAGHLPVGLVPRLAVPASAEVAQLGLAAGTAATSTGASSVDTAASSLAAEVGAGQEAAGGLLLRCLGYLVAASWLHGQVFSRSGLAWPRVAGCRMDAEAAEVQVASARSSSDCLACWQPSGGTGVR